jgi:hypothetical protein
MRSEVERARTDEHVKKPPLAGAWRSAIGCACIRRMMLLILARSSRKSKGRRNRRADFQSGNAVRDVSPVTMMMPTS